MFPKFTSVQEYGRHFTDVNVWRMAVEQVCHRHQLPIGDIQAGLAGTHPVFFIRNDQSYIIKFYETHFFTGTRSYRMERTLYQWLPSRLPIAVPQLIASGTLAEEGAWPYIVTSVIPGVSFGEVRHLVSTADTLTLATWLGQSLRHLHSIPIGSEPILVHLRPEFGEFIAHQYEQCVANHERWQTLPPHLIAQIPRYLAEHHCMERVDTYCLIHADLTHDHVLGEFHDGRWRTTGLIDFGDAWIGDRLYELIALHLSVFQTDTQLLQTFLTAYTFDAALREHFVERAMCATLLFEFNAFGTIALHRPAALMAGTLEEVAAQVWAVT